LAEKSKAFLEGHFPLSLSWTPTSKFS